MVANIRTGHKLNLIYLMRRMGWQIVLIDHDDRPQSREVVIQPIGEWRFSLLIIQ